MAGWRHEIEQENSNNSNKNKNIKAATHLLRWQNRSGGFGRDGQMVMVVLVVVVVVTVGSVPFERATDGLESQRRQTETDRNRDIPSLLGCGGGDGCGREKLLN